MDWHARFVQQAGWTRELRAHLFKKAGIETAKRILEVGCGTGAILADINSQGMLVGLDINPNHLHEAGKNVPTARLVRGDANHLPLPAQQFDITYCHFLLLWVPDPLSVLKEMKRVTRTGGAVLALAEPDYDHRVDEPAPLAPLGRWQAESLRRQGADPGVGRRLADLFQLAGIRTLETGALKESDLFTPSPEQRAMEWAVLISDMRGLVPRGEIQRMKEVDERAWQAGTRRLHVPTYFAFGMV